MNRFSPLSCVVPLSGTRIRRYGFLRSHILARNDKKKISIFISSRRTRPQEKKSSYHDEEDAMSRRVSPIGKIFSQGIHAEETSSRRHSENSHPKNVVNGSSLMVYHSNAKKICGYFPYLMMGEMWYEYLKLYFIDIAIRSLFTTHTTSLPSSDTGNTRISSSHLSDTP